MTVGRADLRAELLRRLGPGWRLAPPSGPGATVLRERDEEPGVWWVLPWDAASPEGARRANAQLLRCAAPFRLLGRSADWSVLTWADLEGERSAAVVLALGLERPAPEVAAVVEAWPFRPGRAR